MGRSPNQDCRRPRERGFLGFYEVREASRSSLQDAMVGSSLAKWNCRETPCYSWHNIWTAPYLIVRSYKSKTFEWVTWAGLDKYIWCLIVRMAENIMDAPKMQIFFKMKYDLRSIGPLLCYEEVAWLLTFRSYDNFDLHSYGQLLSLFLQCIGDWIEIVWIDIGKN